MIDPATNPADAPLRPMVCYDGDCGMCRSTVEGIVRLGFVQRERVAAFQSFDADVAGKLLDANVHNELAVLDTENHEIRSGIRGLLWAFEGSWLKPLLPIARFGPVLGLLELAYRLIAYNRRILSPVKLAPGQIACACDPDFHVGLRVGFLLGCWSATALVAHVLGVVPFALGVFAMLLPVALLRPGSREERIDRVGHVSWVTLLATALTVLLHFGRTGRGLGMVLPFLFLAITAERRRRAFGWGGLSATSALLVRCLFLLAGVVGYLATDLWR